MQHPNGQQADFERAQVRNAMDAHFEVDQADVSTVVESWA